MPHSKSSAMGGMISERNEVIESEQIIRVFEIFELSLNDRAKDCFPRWSITYRESGKAKLDHPISISNHLNICAD